MEWHDVADWHIEGKGWFQTADLYGRLPDHAQARVPNDVWVLGRHSTGLYVQFETDSTAIHARWSLALPADQELHMPATGVSGLDLYARDASGSWRWLAVGPPVGARQSELRLTYGLDGRRRSFRLYLPLHNIVASLAVGVQRGAVLRPVASSPHLPIVIYGTSIVHGIAASRPGACHTAILGRWLDRPVINLGFSGRGKMELGLAELIAEIDACTYVIDCLPNMDAELISERAEPFLRLLRARRCDTPIVLVEDRTYPSGWAIAELAQRQAKARGALARVCERLVVDGLGPFECVAGNTLLGEDGEGTVDGSHPTDGGFLRIARALKPTLQALL